MALALGMDIAGVSAYRAIRGMGTVAEAALSVSLGRPSALSAASQTAAIDIAKFVGVGPVATGLNVVITGGHNYGLSPNWQEAYDFVKIIPLAGAGLELGEAIHSCGRF